MPELPLGRLFWKFLLFFFLAQTTAVLGIGLAIWATHPEHDFPPPPPFGSAPSAEELGCQGQLPPSFSPERGPEGARRPPPPRGPKPPIFHLLAGAVVSLIFAALLATYVARPIRRLRQALQAGAQGELNPGVSAAMGNRRDELADLGQDFDRMAQHIAQLMQGQRRLLHDVSHELRSPLARLNAIIGLARQQPECLEDCLLRLERESSRMDRLLSELLTLSRLESGMEKPLEEPVDLAELLDDVVSDAAPEAEQAGCRVELKSAGRGRVRGDAEMLHRVFDNLLRNALAHASDGGWVGITLTESGNELLIRVEDGGSGVPDAELEQLFIPFYRGTNTPGKKGHGLGLAIAQQIVEHHQGRIEAANRPEGGLCLTVVLPKSLFQ
ncbi:MAG: HAMP domain-containing sensor histidine kinase [Betaproteobacteria bacterium]